MDLYVSHDLALQSLSGGGTSDNLKMMRNASETTKYSYSVGARFGFTFPSGVGVKTGLNISKVRRGFSYDEIDGMDTMSTSSLSTGVNTYTFVDIPLLFSYEMSGVGGFYYNVNAGMLFNMTLTAEGKFLSPSGEVVSFTRGVEERFIAYEKTSGTSLYASFGLHYVWSKTLDFVIEPNIRYSLAPISLSDYPLDEKFTTVGLITGIRYKF